MVKNIFFYLLKNIGRAYFNFFFSHIDHHLFFWYFVGFFSSWYFDFVNFLNQFLNLLKKLCRDYFLHFVKIIHQLGFWYFWGVFF